MVWRVILQDKERAMPQELGRNVRTVQVLQRKHETFERELTALGTKVTNHLEGPWSLLAPFIHVCIQYLSLGC